MQWVKRALFRLHSAIEEFKRAVQNVFASQCTSGLCILKCRLPDHPGEDLKKF